MGNHVVTEVIVMAIVISVVLLFLGMGVLVLIHVCIVGRTLGRESSERNMNMVERGSLGSTSMSQDDIEKLPCFDFKAQGGSSPPADCAVCLESFRAGERCRLLPSCNHTFHAECVDLWLLRAPICPICRGGADCAVEELRDLEAAVSSSNVGDELGFDPTVEVLDSSEREVREDEEEELGCISVGDEMVSNPTGEVLVSSERVIEVRERQENDLSQIQ